MSRIYHRQQLIHSQRSYKNWELILVTNTSINQIEINFEEESDEQTDDVVAIALTG